MAVSEDFAIVVDNGASFLKAGFAGDGAPRILIPMLTGRPRDSNNQADWYVGDHARALRDQLVVDCPISNGLVKDWEQLSMVWYYMFLKELRVNPSNHPVLVTEYPFLPKESREKMAEMIFEKFQMPAMYATSQSVLALYASGRTTGLVFDMGTETSSFVPVYNTYPINECIKTRQLGGTQITDYLRHMIIAANSGTMKSVTREFAQSLKEKICYVTMDYDTDLKQMKETPGAHTDYRLPDGQVIRLDREPFAAPEMMFNPHLAGLQGPGLQQTIFDSINECNVELHPYLFSDIVLSGGGTLFPGFPDRLTKELSALIKQTNLTVNIHQSAEQKYAVWIGGSILASLSTFKKICVQKSEYEEHGARIIHMKCK